VLETGEPAGQGALSGSVYYLPLHAGALENAPAVYVIDLEKGTVVARLPAREPPGNLIFAGEVVVAQSLTNVTAYPQPAPGERP
jgi:hypothetical protein